MLNKVEQENIEAGVPLEDAAKSKRAALDNLKELYAKNGMLDLMKQT